MENLKLLLQLYFRPISANSELMDKGSWMVSAVLVFIISAAFYFTVNQKLQDAYGPITYDTYFSEEARELEVSDDQYDAMIADYQKALKARKGPPLVGDRLFWFFSFSPAGFLSPLISMALFYIPLTIFFVALFGQLGSFGVVFQRDYGSLSVCAFSAWAAAHLPFAIAGIGLYGGEIDPLIYFIFWAASGLVFAVLMVFALRVVFGVNWGAAMATVCISWLGFSLGMYIFKFVSPWLFSPFILLFAYMYFGGAISGGASGVGNTFRQRQNFKRYLQSATINPKDADAHVQLGLIYNQRRQMDKAFEHFTKAFEIDNSEPDANYELGRIARIRGEFQKAIEHFSVVVGQNDKYALSDIWREIGATYMDAGMLPEAKDALEKFTERRPYDPEGLYYLGKCLKAQGDSEKAREAFQEAIDAANNSPGFRRNEVRRWGKLAQKEI